MWSRIDGLTEPTPYGMAGMLQLPCSTCRTGTGSERAWPARADDTGSGIVTLDPDAPGEVHSPLNYAPLPDSIARPLFDEAAIEAYLDHLAAGQRDDGGWMFNWLSWSPAAELEWRGFMTVSPVALRANGRL